MGRTKGQLEKFDLGGLDTNHLRRILRRGELGLRASFSELEEFESSLSRIPTSPNGEDSVTTDEVFEMEQWLCGYFDELLIRIASRIEMSRAASKRAGADRAIREQELELLCALEEKLQSAADRQYSVGPPESESVNAPRMAALEIYLGLKKQIGRPPLRSEIEAAVGDRTEARAVSRAIERMGLRMTDKRIGMQLQRVLNHLVPLHLTRGGSRFVGCQIQEALSTLRMKSPEADLMRSPLRRSSVDRLTRVISDRRLESVVVDEYKLVLKNPSDEKRSLSLGDGGPIIEVGPKHFAIDGLNEIVELLEAFRALAETWRRVRHFGIDFSWVQPSRRPDFNNVLDILILSVAVGMDSRKSVGSWISEVIRQPYLRVQAARAMPSCWEPPNLLIKSWVNLPAGIDRLFNVIEGVSGTHQLVCEALMERDAVFAALVEFLEPFDAILKALDYGIEVSHSE